MKARWVNLVFAMAVIAASLFAGCGFDSAGDANDAATDDDVAADDDSVAADDTADDDDVASDDDTADDDAQEFDDILPRSNPPHHLYVLDILELDLPDRVLAQSFQGLVNRAEPEIYLDRHQSNGHERDFLEFYEQRHGVTSEDATDLWSLAALFADRVNGAVVWDPEVPDTINVATTIAGLANLVVAHPDQIDALGDAGISVVEDLRGRWSDKVEAYDWALANLAPHCADFAVADLAADLYGPRDYLIQHKIFTFRYKPIAGELGAMLNVLRAFPDNIPVLGYLAADGTEEVTGEVALSFAKKILIPSDFTTNLSVHSGIEVDPIAFELPIPDVNLTPDQIRASVFVAFAISDGDNYTIPTQIIPEDWEQAGHGAYPTTWSLPGTIATLAPGIAEYFFANRDPNDHFAMMSNVGYIYSSLYADRDVLEDLTANYARYTRFDTNWQLDPVLDLHLPQIIDDYLVGLANRTNLKGFASGYARTFAPCGFLSDGTPILYNRLSYEDDPVTTIPTIINNAMAQKAPDKPVYLFFGGSSWTVHPDEIAAAMTGFAGNENVRPIFLPQMFDLMRDFPPRRQ